MPTDPSPGRWYVGRGGTVVTDQQTPDGHQMGADDLRYYGGYLLAESIARSADAHVMAASKDLLEVVEIIRDAANDRIKDGLGHELPPMIRAKMEAALKKAIPDAPQSPT